MTPTSTLGFQYQVPVLGSSTRFQYQVPVPPWGSSTPPGVPVPPLGFQYPPWGSSIPLGFQYPPWGSSIPPGVPPGLLPVLWLPVAEGLVQVQSIRWIPPTFDATRRLWDYAFNILFKSGNDSIAHSPLAGLHWSDGTIMSFSVMSD